MGKWQDKVVWITGGGTGLGKFMAVEFARGGAQVAVSGRREDRLQGAVEALEALGARAIAVPCDVTDEAQLQSAVETVVDTFGRLDVAVANAGFSVAGRVEKLTFEDWRRQFDVNVCGAAMTCAKAIPALRQTQGRVALVGSVAAMVHFAKAGPYQASKAAIHALGNTLALELARDGISVTTLHPGFVDSEIGQVNNAGVYDPDQKDIRPPQLMWETEPAARRMVEAIYRRKREYVFTGHGRFGWFMARHFPSVTHAVASRLR